MSGAAALPGTQHLVDECCDSPPPQDLVGELRHRRGRGVPAAPKACVERGRTRGSIAPQHAGRVRGSPTRFARHRRRVRGQTAFREQRFRGSNASCIEALLGFESGGDIPRRRCSSERARHVRTQRGEVPAHDRPPSMPRAAPESNSLCRVRSASPGASASRSSPLDRGRGALHEWLLLFARRGASMASSGTTCLRRCC